MISSSVHPLNRDTESVSIMASGPHTQRAGCIVLQGAALDTSNLGCSALSLSVIFGIQRRLPDIRIAVGDFGRGFRTKVLSNNGKEHEITLFGSVNTRRVYRTDSIYGMAFCSALGGLGHPVLKLYREAAAVLDISGGDSFSDIYGTKFFRANTLRKKLALKEGKSLILLPQTYGPYKSSHSRRVAAEIVRSASMAWARDEHSFHVLRDLLGDAFDPGRHRVGVDVAFGLPKTRPADGVIAGLIHWFEDKRSPLVGINVSGLLLNRPEEAAIQYGLRADYREVLLQFIRQLLHQSDARILLVPHVVAPPGHYESDIGACESIAEVFRDNFEDRVAIAPSVQDPCEAKWIIAQCDWFCGTRMHSTIAALSSGVPTAAISYSPKTLGVFETCGQGAHVADPRTLDSTEMAQQLWNSWSVCGEARQSLRTALPLVLRQGEDQMTEIVAQLVGCAGYFAGNEIVRELQDS